MRMRKDMLPLYLAIASGSFSLLNVLVENLTKNMKVVVNVPSPTSASQKVVETVHTATPQILVMLSSKPIVFGAISVIAIIVFIILKFYKHTKSRRTTK